MNSISYKSERSSASSREIQERWQWEALQKIRDKRYSMVVAPPGSGKSFLIRKLAVYNLLPCTERKQLILCPRGNILKDIAKTASIDLKELGGKRTVTIPSATQFFGDGFDGEDSSIINSLKNWLLQDFSPKYALALASHQAFAMLLDKMSLEEIAKASENLDIHIDEAHHLRVVSTEVDMENSSLEEIEEVNQSRNRLTSILEHFLRNSSARLHMYTATPFRGDEAILYRDDMQKLLQENTYTLSDKDYWDLTELESFHMAYYVYPQDASPIPQIIDFMEKDIQDGKEEYYLIFVPAMGRTWREHHENDIDTLIEWARGKFGAEAVCNLVTRPGSLTIKEQKANLSLLQKEPGYSLKRGHKRKIRVVIACSIFSEGSNWIPCSRIHNAAAGNSLTLEIQKLGRALRACKGKDTVDVFNYLGPLGTDEEVAKQLIKNRVNAVLLGLTFDIRFKNILFEKVKPLPKSKDEDIEGEPITPVELPPVPPFDPRKEAPTCLSGSQIDKIRRAAVNIASGADFHKNGDKVRSEVKSLLSEIQSDAPFSPEETEAVSKFIGKVVVNIQKLNRPEPHRPNGFKDFESMMDLNFLYSDQTTPEEKEQFDKLVEIKDAYNRWLRKPVDQPLLLAGDIGQDVMAALKNIVLRVTASDLNLTEANRLAHNPETGSKKERKKREDAALRSKKGGEATKTSVENLRGNGLGEGPKKSGDFLS